MVNVMLTGASGLLGRAIFKVLSSVESVKVLGLCYTRQLPGLVKCDLTNLSEIEKIVTEFKPALIVHSAAERRPDVLEKQPDSSKKLNVDATQTLCNLAAAHGACLLFISTDYVFDGRNPPYAEDAKPNPLNIYGRFKIDAENMVLSNGDNLVLRVPVLYGEVTHLEESAVTILFKKVMDTSQPSPMSHYERRYPTHCADIANFVKEVILRKFVDKTDNSSEIRGVLHFSGSEEMTKYDMSVTMATLFDLPSNHLIADTTASGGASRPYNAQLGCERAGQLGLPLARTSFREGIKECLQPHFHIS